MIKNMPNPIGRPTSYKPEYCQLLEEHMSRGGSFKSFGADIRATESMLYNWLDAHPDFRESKKLGETLSARFYEELGKRMVAGQLRRVKSEKVAYDENGVPLRDDSGAVIMNREYEATQGNATVWIFMMKNMHKWRDNVNVAVSGDGEGGAININHRAETLEQKLARLDQANKVLKELENGTIDITSLQRRPGRSDRPETEGARGKDKGKGD